MYKFYGGTLPRHCRLTDSLRPLQSYGDSLADNILTAVVNAYRSYEHGAIITEFHRKEALPYDLYYDSFDSNFPAGRGVNTMDTILPRYYGNHYGNAARRGY